MFLPTELSHSIDIFGVFRSNDETCAERVEHELAGIILRYRVGLGVPSVESVTDPVYFVFLFRQEMSICCVDLAICDNIDLVPDEIDKPMLAQSPMRYSIELFGHIWPV